jgi:hypothetical protein
MRRLWAGWPIMVISTAVMLLFGVTAGVTQGDWQVLWGGLMATFFAGCITYCWTAR